MQDMLSVLCLDVVALSCISLAEKSTEPYPRSFLKCVSYFRNCSLHVSSQVPLPTKVLFPLNSFPVCCRTESSLVCTSTFGLHCAL